MKIALFILSLALIAGSWPTSAAQETPDHIQSFEFSAPSLTTTKFRIVEPNPVVNEGRRVVLRLTDDEDRPIPGATWSSGSPDIARVDPETGLVRGLKRGFATITAQVGDERVSTFVVVAQVRQGPGITIPGDSKVDRNGHLFISDPLENVVLRATNVLTAPPVVFAGRRNIPGLRDGSAAQALFAGPTAIALDQRDSGGMFLADTLNHRIRRIGFDNEVETVLGGGDPGVTTFQGGAGLPFEAVRFNSPRGLATDAAGHLFIADTDNHAVYYADLAARRVHLLAGLPGESGDGDGPGKSARFARPAGIALSRDGSVLAVADQDNDRVRLLELYPTDDGTLTCQVSTVGKIESVRGFGLLPPTTFIPSGPAYEFPRPQSVSFDAAGNLIVTDRTGVRLVTRPAGRLPALVNVAQPNETFQRPACVTTSGNLTYVLDATFDPTRGLTVISVGAPKIREVAAEDGRLAPGDTVLVAGKNFGPETVVLVDDQLVFSAEPMSATRLRFSLPPDLKAGDHRLRLQTRGGEAETTIRVVP